MRSLKVISQEICVKIETTVKDTLLMFDCVHPSSINNLIKLMFSASIRGTGPSSNYANPANDAKNAAKTIFVRCWKHQQNSAEETNKDVLSANKDSCESPTPEYRSLTMLKVYSFASCKRTRFHFHHDGNFNNAFFVPPGLFSALP